MNASLVFGHLVFPCYRGIGSPALAEFGRLVICNCSSCTRTVFWSLRNCHSLSNRLRGLTSLAASHRSTVMPPWVGKAGKSCSSSTMLSAICDMSPWQSSKTRKTSSAVRQCDSLSSHLLHQRCCPAGGRAYIPGSPWVQLIPEGSPSYSSVANSFSCLQRILVGLGVQAQSGVWLTPERWQTSLVLPQHYQHSVRSSPLPRCAREAGVKKLGLWTTVVDAFVVVLGKTPTGGPCLVLPQDSPHCHPEHCQSQ